MDLKDDTWKKELEEILKNVPAPEGLGQNLREAFLTVAQSNCYFRKLLVAGGFSDKAAEELVLESFRAGLQKMQGGGT